MKIFNLIALLAILFTVHLWHGQYQAELNRASTARYNRCWHSVNKNYDIDFSTPETEVRDVKRIDAMTAQCVEDSQ